MKPRDLILTQKTTIPEIMVYIQAYFDFQYTYLTQDQFCFVVPQIKGSSWWITIKQEKSIKLALSCPHQEDLSKARTQVITALLGLGFKVKG